MISKLERGQPRFPGILDVYYHTDSLIEACDKNGEPRRLPKIPIKDKLLARDGIMICY